MTLLAKIGVRHPIFQAPMAGGPDTPALAAAVAEAGGLGALGCGYLSPSQIEELIAAYRARSTRPVAINLFVREEVAADDAAAARVAPILDGIRRELRCRRRPPSLRRRRIPRSSKRCCAPNRASSASPSGSRRPIKSRGCARPTSSSSAPPRRSTKAKRWALGVDAICAQGSEAGGHRGGFLGRPEDSLVGTMALTRLPRRARARAHHRRRRHHGRRRHSRRARPRRRRRAARHRVLALPRGWHAAAHRAALQSPAARQTVITRAFSGRAARGIANRFTQLFAAVDPPPFPQQQALTTNLRVAAAKQARPDLMQLWAGQGAPLIRALPAAELMRALLAEAGLS